MAWGTMGRGAACLLRCIPKVRVSYLIKAIAIERNVALKLSSTQMISSDSD
jgi:hypothetical protein